MQAMPQPKNKKRHAGRKHKDAPPRYEPTPAQIEAECIEIRKGWSDDRLSGGKGRIRTPLKDSERRMVRISGISIEEMREL